MKIDATSRQEILTISELINYLENYADISADFVNLDLVGYAHLFKKHNIENAIFINCHIPNTLKKQIHSDGAMVLKNPKDNCFNIYPTEFYDAQNLYSVSYSQNKITTMSFDSIVYDWFIENKKPRKLSPSQSIFAKTHDTALERLIARKIRQYVEKTDMLPIAIMGGHAKKRGDLAYENLAKLSRQLARRGHLIVTGGGPGLMEAANLGALCAPLEDEVLNAALNIVRECDDYHDNLDNWLETGFRARKMILDVLGAKIENATNLSIPTWHYGHEPSNVFATHIAKFFYNSLREDGLVSIADGGIVFAEGNAGTLQEIFQDACQNYYRDASETPTPMVFLNSQKNYWEAASKTAKTKPLRPLIEQLAGELPIDREFLSALFFSDNIDEILNFFENYHEKQRDTVSLGHYWRLSMNGHALGDPER